MKQRSVKRVKSTNHYVYRIYYGDSIVYVGRTNQSLATRMRGHFFSQPMHRVIDIESVTKIEYSVFATVADMYLYEIYYINKYHPALNRDDRARDNLTVALPEVEWLSFWPPLMDKWKDQIREREIAAKEKARLKLEREMREHEDRMKRRKDRIEQGCSI